MGTEARCVGGECRSRCAAHQERDAGKEGGCRAARGRASSAARRMRASYTPSECRELSTSTRTADTGAPSAAGIARFALSCRRASLSRTPRRQPRPCRPQPRAAEANVCRRAAVGAGRDPEAALATQCGGRSGGDIEPQSRLSVKGCGRLPRRRVDHSHEDLFVEGERRLEACGGVPEAVEVGAEAEETTPNERN